MVCACSPVTSICLSVDGSMLFSVARDSTLRAYTLKEGHQVCAQQKPGEWIRRVSLNDLGNCWPFRGAYEK